MVSKNHRVFCILMRSPASRSVDIYFGLTIQTAILRIYLWHCVAKLLAISCEIVMYSYDPVLRMNSIEKNCHKCKSRITLSFSPIPMELPKINSWWIFEPMDWYKIYKMKYKAVVRLTTMTIPQKKPREKKLKNQF